MSKEKLKLYEKSLQKLFDKLIKDPNPGRVRGIIVTVRYNLLGFFLVEIEIQFCYELFKNIDVRDQYNFVKEILGVPAIRPYLKKLTQYIVTEEFSLDFEWLLLSCEKN